MPAFSISHTALQLAGPGVNQGAAAVPAFTRDYAHLPHPQHPSVSFYPPKALDTAMTEEAEREGSSSSGGSSPSFLFHQEKETLPLSSLELDLNTNWRVFRCWQGAQDQFPPETQGPCKADNTTAS